MEKKIQMEYIQTHMLLHLYTKKYFYKLCIKKKSYLHHQSVQEKLLLCNQLCVYCSQYQYNVGEVCSAYLSNVHLLAAEGELEKLPMEISKQNSNIFFLHSCQL